MKTKMLLQIFVLLAMLVFFMPVQTDARAAAIMPAPAKGFDNPAALKAAIQTIRNMEPFTKIVAGARADIGMPYGDRGKQNSNPGYGPWKYQYGKCTDSVIDAWVAAGVVSGWGPDGPAGVDSLRNVGNMFTYFKKQQIVLGMNEPWLPGDVAFFAAYYGKNDPRNESDDAPGSHVEIVIAVDDQGNPTSVINAGRSDGTAYERNYYQQISSNPVLRVTRHGRLTTLNTLFSAIYSAQLYTSTLASQSANELTLQQGQSADLWVKFNNIGSMSWNNNGANLVRLGTTDASNNATDYSSPFVCSSSWPTSTRLTVMTEPSVAPGGTGTFNFKICVPSGLASGTYYIGVAPVVEGITWMIQPNVRVYWKVNVTPIPFPGTVPTPQTYGYKQITGTAIGVWSHLYINTADATLKVCTADLYNQPIGIELYRSGRVWDFQIDTTGKTVKATTNWGSGTVPMDVVAEKVTITRSNDANYGSCYTATNLDGNGNTLAGARYYSVVWYITGSTSATPPAAVAQKFLSGCYNDPTVNRTAMCDSNIR